MVLLLHGFLLPCGMFEGSFYTFSMSQQGEKCREVFSLVMNAPAQFIKCGCSVPAFSRSLSRCFPLSSHAPVLRLWCADGSSSARRTSSVLSLHRQRRPAEQESRPQSREPHAAGSHGWKRRPSQRSRPWPGSIRLGGPALPLRAIRLLASLCFHSSRHTRADRVS